MASGFAITAKFGVDAKGVQTGVNTATKHVKKATKDIESMRARIKNGFGKVGSGMGGLGKAALGAAAGFFALDSAASFGKSVLALGGEITDTADRLNLSTDSVQGLTFAFSQSGATSKNFEKGLVSLNQKLEEARDGSEGAKLALRAVGLSMKDIRSLTPEEALLKIADYARDATDPVGELAAVTEVLGKSAGTRLNAGLRKGSESLRKLSAEAPKMSANTIDKLDNAGDAVDRLTRRLKAMAGEWLIKVDASLGGVPSKLLGAGGSGGAVNPADMRKPIGSSLDRKAREPLKTDDIKKRREQMGMTADQRRQMRAKDRLERRINGEFQGAEKSKAQAKGDASDKAFMDGAIGGRKNKAATGNAADAVGDVARMDAAEQDQGHAEVDRKGYTTNSDIPNPTAPGFGAPAISVPTPPPSDWGGGDQGDAILGVLKTMAGYLSKGGPIVMK